MTAPLVVVTGAAGFIGSHLCRRLLLDGYDVVGLDNLSDYYDVNLKLLSVKWLMKLSRAKQTTALPASVEAAIHSLPDVDVLQGANLEGPMAASSENSIGALNASCFRSSAPGTSSSLGRFDFRVVDIRNQEALYELFSQLSNNYYPDRDENIQQLQSHLSVGDSSGNANPSHCTPTNGDERGSQKIGEARVTPAAVVHLAAQAGVGYSAENPIETVSCNVLGTTNLLQCCVRFCPSAPLLIASSSSVYGQDSPLPFDERSAACGTPLSIYAASKRSSELLSYAYYSLYCLKIVQLRFFTVYGPRGRPDMSCFRFSEAILRDRPITVCGDGSAVREFTYIDDIVCALTKLLRRVVLTPLAAKDSPTNSTTAAGNYHVNWYERSATSQATTAVPWNQDWYFTTLNIGGGTPYTINELIACIESATHKSATRTFSGQLQPGDMRATAAAPQLAESAIQFRPSVSLSEGIAATVKWMQWWIDFQSKVLPQPRERIQN